MPPFLKFVAVLIIWVMASVITILQSVVNDGAGFNWIFSVVLFGIAAGVTSTIMNDSNGDKNAPMIEVNTDEKSRDSGGKRKNDQAGGLSAEMLALLDEDDIAELRQRVKNRLIDRIEGGSDGELSSLDALLADQDSTAHKSRR